MNSRKRYQLVAVDKFGNQIPVLDKPGQPVKVFAKKKDAIAHAEEHPELFRTGIYAVNEVLQLTEEAEETETDITDKEDITFKGEAEEE
jgi:hypothetical protein